MAKKICARKGCTEPLPDEPVRLAQRVGRKGSAKVEVTPKEFCSKDCKKAHVIDLLGGKRNKGKASQRGGSEAAANRARWRNE